MALTITIGDEYKIIIEKEEEFEKSNFSNLYKEASRNIEAIISQSILARSKSANHESSISDDSYNNIIAFTGERGTGKSSSMISFAGALIREQGEGRYFSREDYPNIWANKIASIDVIDPSLFRGDDQLFEIIISKMFAKFQEKLHDNTKEINHDQKRKLIERFQHVFNNLKVVHKGKKEVYEKEAIEALSDLAYGSNLKSSFKCLVDDYLKYIGDGSNFLLIAIDDFDLNISGAYEMLEDIRQFLVQSNIIILVACKIEQLQDSINNEIIKEYEFLLNKNLKHKEKLSEEIKEKSRRYLEKLFPSAHILTLPKLRTYSLDSEFKLKEGDEIIATSNSFESWILEFIYQQTEVFISRQHLELNSLIPSTLRELSNLITTIYNSGNKLISFKEYVLSKVSNDLNQSHVKSITHLESKGGKSLIYSMLHTLGEFNSRFDGVTKHEYRNLFFPKAIENVSLGDVYVVFKLLDEDLSPIERDLEHYINLLKIYFSIRVKEHELDPSYDSRELYRGGYFNKHFKIFRNDQATGVRRDWVEIYPKKFEAFRDTPDLLYWVNFFISSLGSEKNNNYRNEQEPYFFKSLNSQGGPIVYAQFSFLTALSRVMFPQEVWNTLGIDSNESVSGDLQNSIDSWNNENNLQTLLNNVFFFNEFIERFDLRTREYKNAPLEGFENALWLYFTHVAEKVFSELQEKYQYLPLEKDIIKRHPIYKFWNDNRDELNIGEKINSLLVKTDEKVSLKTDDSSYKEVLGKVSEIFNTEKDVDKSRLQQNSKWMLNHYSHKYFKTQSYTNQGAKMAMNNLAKQFKFSKPIGDLFWEYRWSMDQNVKLGLEKIEILLNTLKDMQ